MEKMLEDTKIPAEVHLKLTSVKISKDTAGTTVYTCTRCSSHPLLDDFQNLVSHNVLNHTDTYTVYCGQCCESFTVSDFADHVNMHMNSKNMGIIAKEEDNDEQNDIGADGYWNQDILESLFAGDKLEGVGAVEIKLEEVPTESISTVKEVRYKLRTKNVYTTRKAQYTWKRKRDKAGCKIYQCDICKRGVQTKEQLENHILHHLKFTCSFCPKIFRSRSQLALHELVHTRAKPFKCTHCELSFRAKIPLDHHLSVAHSIGEPFQCDFCKKRITAKKHLRTHIKNHTFDRPWLCALCGMDFVTKTKLKYHNRLHSNKDAEDKIKKQFKRRAALDAKWGGLDFKCKLCKAAYKTKAELDDHVLVHPDPNPYKCHNCPLKFPKKSCAERHMLAEYGKIQCSLCPWSNASERAYRRFETHMQIHDGTTYDCEQCGKSFFRRGVLRTHQLVHSDKRPFPCVVCGKCFKAKSQLKDHAVLHSGKPSRFTIYRREKQLMKNLTLDVPNAGTQ